MNFCNKNFSISIDGSLHFRKFWVKLLYFSVNSLYDEFNPHLFSTPYFVPFLDSKVRLGLQTPIFWHQKSPLTFSSTPGTAYLSSLIGETNPKCHLECHSFLPSSHTKLLSQSCLPQRHLVHQKSIKSSQSCAEATIKFHSWFIEPISPSIQKRDKFDQSWSFFNLNQINWISRPRFEPSPLTYLVLKYRFSILKTDFETVDNFKSALRLRISV